MAGVTAFIAVGLACALVYQRLEASVFEVSRDCACRRVLIAGDNDRPARTCCFGEVTLLP